MSRLFETLRATQDWEIRYQLLIEAGRQLAEFPDSLKTPAHKIQGCFSPTWLQLNRDQKHYSLKGYSKSHIVMGLIALLAEYIQEHSQEDVSNLTVSVFDSLSLDELITQTRQNGFTSMIEYIKQAL